MFLGYTDENTLNFNGQVIGVSIIGITAGLAGVFTLLTKNLQGKSFKFPLTDDEQEAVDAIEGLYDPSAEARDLTESGTVGYVQRRELAEYAKSVYQSGRSDREVRDKSLYYAEVDLGFLATLLRISEPRGGVFYDLGSGTGKAVLAAGKLGGFKKVVGIELLSVLNKEAQKYAGKYRGKARAEFVNKDFMDSSVKLSDADVIFAYATRYFSTTDGKYAVDVTEKILASAPIGARIIMLDKQLKGNQFKLLKTIDDPAGDLQRVKGYVYERVA